LFYYWHKGFVPNLLRVEVSKRKRHNAFEGCRGSNLSVESETTNLNFLIKSISIEFNELENLFNDEMEYVIDWFNNEFDLDAEYVTYYN
jgi:hypothetical protein